MSFKMEMTQRILREVRRLHPWITGALLQPPRERLQPERLTPAEQSLRLSNCKYQIDHIHPTAPSCVKAG